MEEHKMSWTNACLKGITLAALATLFSGGAEVRAAYNDVLVTNIAGGNVTQYNPVTGANAGSGVFAGSPLMNPRGIAVGPDTSVYVNDLGRNAVYKFDGAGNLVGGGP